MTAPDVERAPQAPATPRDRRAELLDAADRVIREHGERTSAALIAKEAGVTKPIIYRHFADIDDLYRELAARYLGMLTAATDRTRPDGADRATRWRTVINGYLRGVEIVPNIYRFVVSKGRLSSSDSDPSSLTYFTHQWAVDLADYFVRESGDRSSAVHGSVMAFGLVGALRGVLDWWLLTGCKDREAVAGAITELLLNGLPEPAPSTTP